MSSSGRDNSKSDLTRANRRTTPYIGYSKVEMLAGKIFSVCHISVIAGRKLPNLTMGIYKIT